MFGHTQVRTVDLTINSRALYLLSYISKIVPFDTILDLERIELSLLESKASVLPLDDRSYKFRLAYIGTERSRTFVF